MIARKLFFGAIVLFAFIGCKKDKVGIDNLQLNRAFIGSTSLDLNNGLNDNMPVDQAISLEFSTALNKESVGGAIILSDELQTIDISYNITSGDKNIAIYPSGALQNNTEYSLTISDKIKGSSGEGFEQIVVKFRTVLGDLEIVKVLIGDKDVTNDNLTSNVPLDFAIEFHFSFPVDETDFIDAIQLQGKDVPALSYSFGDNNQTVTLSGDTPLSYLSKYQLEIKSSLTGAAGELFDGYSLLFYSELDTTPKFPEISDDELLTKVQQYTFKYFWDFGHPVSGLTRERNTSGETVASGGSGFGIMAIITGIERGFVSRADGIMRLKTMVEFLEQSDRFHGAWPHWLNGTTGAVIPFSTKDNGGDLVETSYVVMGMLTLRQYLDPDIALESELINKINLIVDDVDWNWYTQGENSLTWHWSPNYDFDINMKIRGWNEALITYVMAAASQTHGIIKEVYEQGWKNSNHFINGKEFYGITLPVGADYGGPLFFEHYSFLGIDPGNLNDGQVDYWEQAVNHSLINRQHCIVNPKNYIGYNENCWGLTASDGNVEYSAHSPNNDRGVITPTAALSSFPFTPSESMDALKHFYYMLGDRLWGPYGFYDAFNVTEEWYATSNIVIDQGPIIVMIENYRSGLLWDLFMSSPEVQQGLDKLGFTY